MSLTFALRTNSAAPAAPLDDGIFMAGTNGRAVILVHGLTGTPAEMRFLAWFLHKQGFTVSCPRLANHGQPLPVLQRTPWEKFYASVRHAYEKVRAEHREIFVGGLSMGALLALLLAEEFPAGIAGVSCLSPTFIYDGWNVPWYQFLLPLGSRTPLGNYFYFKEQPPYGLKNERIRERVHQFYATADIHAMHEVDRFGYPFFPVRLLGELQRLVAHVTPRLAAVRSPCQIVQARHDDMSSVRNAQIVYDGVASARKEIVYLENSYHVITADQERGKVAASMWQFFSHDSNHH